jgi:hypothetical protein
VPDLNPGAGGVPFVRLLAATSAPANPAVSGHGDTARLDQSNAAEVAEAYYIVTMSKVGGYRGFSYFRDVCTRETNPGIRTGSVPLEFRCQRIAKSTGEQCRCPRVRGTTLCRTHGGKRPGMKMSRAKQLRLAARLRAERPDHWVD